MRFKIPQKPAFTEICDLDMAARDALRAYKAIVSHNRTQQATSIAKAGCELDLIRCYLQGFSIKQTLEYLRINCGLKSSMSGVGRYWTVLQEAGWAKERIYKGNKY